MGMGTQSDPPDLGPPGTPQHPPLVCPHQVNVVRANAQQSSSFLDGIMALGRKTGPGLGGTPGNRFWVTSGTRLGVIPLARFWGDLSDQVLG